jgi:hypothetical protein
MKKVAWGVFASFLCLSAPLPASAQVAVATLSSVDGSVFVKHNGETKPVSGDVELFEGDQILVTEESSARLVYSDGCAVELGPDSVTNVAGAGECSGDGRADADEPTGDQAGTGGGGGDNTALIAGGSVLLAGGVAAILLSGGGGGGDNGASP